jgi:hypothetical protein
LWAPAPAPTAVLRVVLHRGELYAMWDAQSPRLSGVTAARLEVRDAAGSRWKDLDRAAISRGAAVVESNGRGLKVRLHGSGWTESTRYAGPRPLNTAAAWDSAAPGVRDDAQAELDDQLARNQELEETLTSLRAELSNRLSPPTSPAPDTAAGNPQTAATGPGRTELQPVGPRFGEPLAAQNPARQVAPAPALPPMAKLPAAYTGPKAGLIYWTGMLKPKSTLRIQGGRPSAGRIMGQLPGVAVKLKVMPAANSPDGLLVYTNNTRHRVPQVSPPDPQNSFQRMTFQYDSRRAQGAVLSAPPSAQTGWMDYSIRAVSEAVTALVIEWEISK